MERTIGCNLLNKYEGASRISGTWKGKPIGGFCFVELLGDWTD